MRDNVQILDCTLRDGGFALEDARKNGIEIGFGSENIDAILQKLISSRLDIIELGAIETSSEDKSDIAIYPDIESVSALIPRARSREQMYAALYRGPDCAVESIPDYSGDGCEIVRVILRYSELQKSLDFCRDLSRKNYKVCIQPMVTMRYSPDELRLLIDAANDMGAYALYFVDSYGYMSQEDVLGFFALFDGGLASPIRIGFHAHNNLNLAFANVLAFISQNSERRLIVDSCLLGMGQGAGNLQTELFADHMNKRRGKAYDYEAILEGCEVIEKFWKSNLWGYSVKHLLPAINNTAYKFSVALRDIHGLSLVEINHILSHIPEDLRHRYTPENTRKLLALFGHEGKSAAP
jgi:4-hydroxy 2-oxovalerate aldolase